MKSYFRLLLKAVLIALIVAELPSNALNENYITVGYRSNTSTISPLGSGYTLNSLPVISLSGVNPEIFKSPTFAKVTGGLSSGDPYTSSINSFLNSGSDAGISKIAMRPLRLGLLVGLGQNNSS